MEIIAVIGNVIVVSAKLTGLFTIRSAPLVDECVACVFIKQNQQTEGIISLIYSELNAPARR